MFPVRPFAALIAALLPVGFLPSAAAAQTSTLSFSTQEGTWISLDVAPDEASLVFELLGDVYTLPVQGGRAQPLLTGRAFQSQPRYSPDGSRLAYVSDETGADNVWIAQADGSGARPLSSHRGTTMLSPEWSADGTAVFVTVVTGGFQTAAELWRYDATTGEGVRVVEQAPAPRGLVSSPAGGAYGAAAAPDGRSVYFTSVTPRVYGSRSGSSSAVFRLDTATGATERVVLEGQNAMKPGVSRDGRRLVYAAMRDGRTGLKVRDLESGTERWVAYPLQRNQLEGRATRDVLPNYAIAPDGASVFVEMGGRIHRVGLDDDADRMIPFEAYVSLEASPALDTPRRVETGPVRARRVQHLTMAPDGRIAVSALARIWVADADGGSPRRLTEHVSPREFMPAWSPDGRWIAYVTWGASGGHLWRARADGSADPERLSQKAALWADPAWTPDGSSVVALTAPLGSARVDPGVVPADARIVRVPASGGSHRDVAPAGGARYPHFAAGEDRLYLTSPTAGLLSMELDGSGRRVEATLPRATLRLSPDASRIVATAGSRLLSFAVPPQGLDGGALEMAAGDVITADGPSAVAWSAAGASLAWATGMEVTRVADVSAAEARERVSLDLAVPRPRSTGSVVLQGGKVVTMRGDEVIEDGEVVVRDGRIVAVGPRGSVSLPGDATVINVSGKVIVPGFIDVHAHLGTKQELLEPESSSAFANLAYGITSVRDPQAPPDIFAVADIVEADGVPGPRIFSTGPGLFSMLNLGSLDDARRALRRYQDEYRTHLLKSYLVGDRQQRGWVLEAAAELGMMPTAEGGADTKANLTHAMDGYSGNEHAVPVAPIYDDVVQLMARSGITYTPTAVVSFGAALPIYRLLAEERPHANPKVSRWFAPGELFARTSTRVLWFPPEDYNDIDVARGANAILQAGGRVALGGHGELQGLSNHWEMKLLARGGMAAHDILRVATIYGAEAIGYGQDLGSLEPGKLADLVVLNSDPLHDIAAAQDIRFVMKGGALYDAETLDQVWPIAKPFEAPWWLARPSGAAGGL